LKKELTFEEAINRLDEIVKLLDGGRVPLDESLKLFEEGARLAEICNSRLNSAEMKIVQLTNTPDGVNEQSFDTNS
jgi:exodeoxyribonuclease VII small subunit